MLMSLASVERWIGGESTGKARDVAFSRADLASLKDALQAGVQENRTLVSEWLDQGRQARGETAVVVDQPQEPLQGRLVGRRGE